MISAGRKPGNAKELDMSICCTDAPAIREVDGMLSTRIHDNKFVDVSTRHRAASTIMPEMDSVTKIT